MTTADEAATTDDTDEFVEYIEARGGDKIAEYLRMLRADYYANERRDGRYFEIDCKQTDGDTIDIGPYLDLAVWFGTVWEREDPHIENNDG